MNKLYMCATKKKGCKSYLINFSHPLQNFLKMMLNASNLMEVLYV